MITIGKPVGYQRLWIFLVALCFAASVFVTIALMTIKGEFRAEALAAIPLITFIAIPATYFVAITVNIMVRLNRWVRTGFDPDDWVVVKGIFRSSVVALLLLFVAILYRYEIVSYDLSKDRYHYLLWDRWTGTTEAKSTDRPDSAVFGRGKSS